MDDQTLEARLAEWRAMPSDIRDPNAYRASPYPSPLDAKLEAFCKLYLEADEGQRARLPHLYARDEPVGAFPKLADWIDSRQRARDDLDKLIEYMRRVSGAITSTRDVPRLRLGLAAAAILQERLDYRDILASLAALHHAAIRAGIDPAPYFQEVAALSRPETGRFIRDFLKRDERDIAQMAGFTMPDD